jgi:DNA polymerase V
MRVLDRINVKFGRNALHSGRMPLDARWAMKREMMSQSYTTSIHHLMRFQAI